jgi:hypothetical protein
MVVRPSCSSSVFLTSPWIVSLKEQSLDGVAQDICKRLTAVDRHGEGKSRQHDPQRREIKDQTDCCSYSTHRAPPLLLAQNASGFVIAYPPAGLGATSGLKATPIPDLAYFAVIFEPAGGYAQLLGFYVSSQ